MKRRQLLKTAALGALAGADLALGQEGQAPRSPASDRIGLGMIGVGGFGLSANLPDFLRNPDVEVVAICDVFERNLEKAIDLAGGKPKRYREYRRLLEDRDVDAVVITTPEHWHALMAIDACDAGKDVYVEKPVAHHIRDGRLIVEAARRNNRVVQVGTQQRSGAHFQRAVKYVQEGRIGDVHYAACWNHSPLPAPRPAVTGGPPSGMDWDLWLGPAPRLPYAEVWNVGRRGYWDFWGGMLTECFHGTKGTLFVDRGGFRITPQTTRHEEPDQPPPGPTTDSRQPGYYYTTEILPEQSDSSQQHGPDVRNFLDCVKSRKRPNADVEAGHHANVACRLGNIAYRVGRRLEWDGVKEQVVGDPEANRLVVGRYREPWTPKGL